MEKSRISLTENEVKSSVDDEFQKLIKDLLTERNFDGADLYFYDNSFWCIARTLKVISSIQNNFEAKNSDIILATSPKCGTTWLKALTHTIINRAKYTEDNINPVTTTNPHQLVLNLELHVFSEEDQNPSLDHLPSPRIFGTHVPFSALPKSVLTSNCRILHISRNPLDQFVSFWHFIIQTLEKERRAKGIETPLPHIDEAFELFCRGVHHCGPFWDNALGYWRASIDHPERVLFLKYEDLKDDINNQVKKIADFLGVGFTIEEVNQGVVEEISNICSFENLKSLPANQDGKQFKFFMNSTFFRNGKVGDWVNYLSPSQAKRLEDITKQKLHGSGLMFKTFCD